MPNNYRSYQQQISPPWLQLTAPGSLGSYGLAWDGALGQVKDYLIERFRQSVKARFPTLAPPDALQLIGNERGIFRGVGETNAAYAARVVKAWDSWQWGGTAFGVLSQLWNVGYKSTVLMSRGVQYTLDVNGNLVSTIGSGWNPRYPNANTPLWSTFSVIIPHPWPSFWLSSGNWTQEVHIGTDTGALGATGVPTPDSQVAVKIIASGAVGTATFQYSTDALSIVWSGTATLNASQALGGTGVTLTASNHFTAGEYYFLSQVPPNDSSADAGVFRAVLKYWKPGFATCVAITVMNTGKLIGYPIRNLGSASDGIIGGCTIQAFTPPT